MSEINIYPFTRNIVLEQKSELEQNELLQDANQDVNPLVVPADYTPVYTTDKPIAGVTDELKTMKPAISVVEAPKEATAPTIQKTVSPATKEQPIIGTIVVTAIAVTVGFFLYKRLTKGK